MGNINYESIMEKVDTRLKKKDMQKKIDAIIDSKMVGTVLAKSAANAFVDVLHSEVDALSSTPPANGGLGPTAISAAKKVSVGTPVKLANNMYSIGISFDGNLSRDSLVPSDFDPIDNIIALLNNGYSAGDYVYGAWMSSTLVYNSWIRSLKNREGAHFINNAANIFKRDYREKYNVIDCKIDDIYES